jgi:two-component system sensor histidine kinase UhpB
MTLITQTAKHAPVRGRPAPLVLRRLLGVPLLWKVLLANLAIMALGAGAGMLATAQLARSQPDVPAAELVLVPLVAAVALSLVVNLIALRAALAPLRRVQGTIQAVRGGDLQARVRPALLTDPEVERVGETLNDMLDELAAVHVRLRALSAGVMDAQEEERRRISRELHDDTAQALTSLLLYAKALEQGDAPPAVRGALAELREEVARSLEGVRRLARELRPSALDDLGLVAALEGYTLDLARRTGLRVRFLPACGGGRLPPQVELALYRIAQEALTNAVKHADARDIEVGLLREPGAISLTVADDGRGFDPERLPAGDRGVGLFGMRERAELTGGTLSITSAPGCGTRIAARIPLMPRINAARRAEMTSGTHSPQPAGTP